MGSLSLEKVINDDILVLVGFYNCIVFKDGVRMLFRV